MRTVAVVGTGLIGGSLALALRRAGLRVQGYDADAGRLARAQDEMDFLLAQLATAVGLGGRDRKAASEAEKARQSVTRAIRGALDRVAEAHPPLGDHLWATIRTGVYTSYSPDPRAPIEWTVSTR